MKVILNATCINDRPSGARQRFIGLYAELIKQLNSIEFIVCEPADSTFPREFYELDNVRVLRTPIPSVGKLSKLIKGVSYWGSLQKKEKFDIVENFSQPIVTMKDARTILTIHDVRRMRLNDYSAARVLYKCSVKNLVNKEHTIITVSFAMKNDILNYFPDANVKVVYNGIDLDSVDNADGKDLAAIRSEYNLPDEFLLSVGHLEKRKNYINLIKAIALLRDRGVNIPLVIIGNDNGFQQIICKQIEVLKLTEQVIIYNNLTNFEVECFYKLCRAFVFPSKYEGFGVPVLEAMAFGVPVLLSDIPVFREITANKLKYFNYDEPEDIAESISEMLSSSSLQSEVVAFGYEQVKLFDFKCLAKEMAELYK